MSQGPFIHQGTSVRGIMDCVGLALFAVSVAATWRYGASAALLVLRGALGAWAGECAWCRRVTRDGSAIVAGTIAALILPASAPLWLGPVAGAVATVLGKHFFGGLGANPFNPAAVSRGLLMLILPGLFFAPEWAVDGISSATPLAKEIGTAAYSVEALLRGDHAGTLAEASPLVVLIAGVTLVSFGLGDWRIPASYLGAVSLLALVLPPGERMAGHAPWLATDPVTQLLGGGTLFRGFLHAHRSGHRAVFARRADRIWRAGRALHDRRSLLHTLSRWRGPGGVVVERDRPDHRWGLLAPLHGRTPYEAATSLASGERDQPQATLPEFVH